MAKEKTVVVLGAGSGGLVAAVRLRQRLGREHRVLLVERRERYEFTPSFLWVMMGWRDRQAVTRDLRRLARRGIELVRGEVAGIDTTERVVRTGEREFGYDYLVVALGADLAPGSLPGLQEAGEAAHSVYDLAGAERLRDALRHFAGGKIAVLISSLPFKCPAAPYETALLLDSMCRGRGVRDKTEITVYTPEPLPMPTAGPEIGQALAGILAARGINYRPNTKVRAVNGTSRELAFEGGKSAGYDLLIAVPPHRAPAVVRASGLGGETGWIPVDPRSLKTRQENVWALGDVAAVKLPSGAMLPKAGVFAHGQAEVVAAQVAGAVQGKDSLPEFGGHGSCFVELGRGSAGFASGNFYAEPRPLVQMRNPGRFRHWQKIAFEKYWLWRWF